MVSIRVRDRLMVILGFGFGLMLCVCVRACVRACVRVCVCVLVREREWKPARPTRNAASTCLRKWSAAKRESTVFLTSVVAARPSLPRSAHILQGSGWLF